MKNKIILIFSIAIFFSFILIVSALPSIPTSSPNYFNCTFEPVYQEDGTRDVWCNFTDSSSSPVLDANISHSTYDTNDWYNSGLMSSKGWFIGYQSVPNAYNNSDNNFTVYNSRTIDLTRRAHIKYGAFTYPFNHITQNFSILLKASSGATTLRFMVCNDTYANDVMENTPVNLSRTSLYDGCQLAGTINATKQGINYNNWTWGTVDVTSAYNNMTANQSGLMDYAIHISSYDNASINPVGWSIADAWMPPYHNETLETFTLLNDSDGFSSIDQTGYTSNGIFNLTYNLNMSGNVLLLHLNESSGTVIDYSGNSNNGVSTDTSQVEGRFSEGYDFDGSTSYINISDSSSLDITQNITAGLWMKLDDVSGWRSLLHKDYGTYTGLYLEIYDGRIYNYDTISTSGAVVEADKWYFVVYTANSSVERIYLDGELLVEETSEFTNINNDYDLWIGKSLEYSNEEVDGILDEVFIFNRSITSEEIYQMYLHGKNKFVSDNRTHNSSTWRATRNFLMASDTITFNETTSYPIFDSDDDYLEPMNYSSYENIRNSSFSNCIYFKRSETSSDLRRLVRWDGAYELSIQSDDIQMILRARSPYYKVTIKSVGDLVDDTEWHHVCGVRDKENEEIKIILDGEKAASAYFNGSRELSATDFDITDNANVIGRDTLAGGNDNGFRGQLAQYMLHNDSHTAGEIFSGINTAWWSLAIGEQVTDNVYATGTLINDSTYEWDDEPGHTPIAFTKIYNMNNGSAFMTYNATEELYHSTYYTNPSQFATSQGASGVNFTTLFEYNSTVNDTGYWHVAGSSNATCDINVNWNWADKTGQYQLARVNWTIDSNIPLNKRNMYLCEDGYSALSECDIYTGDSLTRHKIFKDYGTATVVCEVQNDYMSEPYYANDTLDIGCWSAYDKYDGTEPSLELESTLYVCAGTHTMVSMLDDSVIKNSGEYSMALQGATIFDGGNERGGHANSSDYRIMLWGYDISNKQQNPNGNLIIQNGDIGFYFTHNLTNSYFANYKFIDMSIGFDLEHDHASNFSIVNNTFTGCGVDGEDPIYITGPNVEIKHNYFNALANDGDKNVYCYGCTNVTLEQNYYEDISSLAIYSSGNTRNVSTALGNFSCEIGDSGSQYPYRDFTNMTGDYLNGASLYGEIIDYYPCTSQVEPEVTEEASSSGGGRSLNFYIGLLDSENRDYSGNLSYGWKMIFEYEGENHTIQLRNIHRGNAEVRFEVHSEKIDVIIEEGEYKRIDLDGDGIEDIILNLNEIFENMKVNLGLEIIDKGSVITGEVIRESLEKIKISKWIWFALGGILIMLIVGFFLIKKKI
jgi:hypothetical protein